MRKMTFDFHVTAELNYDTVFRIPQDINIVLENGQNFKGRLVGVDVEYDNGEFSSVMTGTKDKS